MQPGTKRGLHVAGKARNTLDDTGATLLPVDRELARLIDLRRRVYRNVQDHLGATFDECRRGQEFDHPPKFANANDHTLLELSNVRRCKCRDG